MSHSKVIHSKPLNERLAHLLGNPEYADFWFHIKEDGSRIPVHKLIVGACSHVLHNIVYGGNSEFVLPVAFSEVDDISGSAFMEVLRYMYTDKPVITDDNVVAILKKSNYFDLDNLQQMCVDHMMLNIRSESCLVLYTQLYAIQPFDHIAQKCLHFIRMHPQIAAFTKPEWTEIECEAVECILSSDIINCDEYTLFGALLKWLRAQDPNDSPKASSSVGLHNCIRWTSLSISEFGQIISLEPEFFSDDEKNNIIQTIRDGSSTVMKRRTWFSKHARWAKLENRTQFPTDAVFFESRIREATYVVRVRGQLYAYTPYDQSMYDEDDEYVEEIDISNIEVLVGSGYKWVEPMDGMLPENMVSTGSLDEDTVVALSDNTLVRMSIFKWMTNPERNTAKDSPIPSIAEFATDYLGLAVLVDTCMDSFLPQTEIPHDAVSASTYGIHQQHPTYLGRVYFDGDILPAVVIPNEGRAVSSYGMSECSLSEYTFLRLPQNSFEWIESSNGRSEIRAIDGGRTRYAEVLYFGRTMHLGTMQYGKIHPSHECLYFGLNGAEVSSRNYEILVRKLCINV